MSNHSSKYLLPIGERNERFINRTHLLFCMIDENEMKRKKMQELANETREAQFDCWFDDNKDDLMKEFTEELWDEFMYFAIKQYEMTGE